mmetsp:Transcript_17087/g.34019  ORF Transcript_17087/g.34019 Transcript_17087/m.34019 type:complete len:390 (-) Transcript_17087:424-1593(-)
MKGTFNARGLFDIFRFFIRGVKITNGMYKFDPPHKPLLHRQLCPQVQHRFQLLPNVTYPIDHKHWPFLDLYVVGMFEEFQQVFEMLRPLVLVAVVLAQEDVVCVGVSTRPPPLPRLVRPGEHEGHVGLAVEEHSLLYLVHDLVIGRRMRTGEPVVVEDESGHSGLPRQIPLSLPGLQIEHVVIPQPPLVDGERFVQPLHLQRFQQCPLREALPPEPVVFFKRVELRKDHRQHPRSRGSLRQGPAPVLCRRRKEPFDKVLHPVVDHVSFAEVPVNFREHPHERLGIERLVPRPERRPGDYRGRFLLQIPSVHFGVDRPHVLHRLPVERTSSGGATSHPIIFACDVWIYRICLGIVTEDGSERRRCSSRAWGPADDSVPQSDSTCLALQVS